MPRPASITYTLHPSPSSSSPPAHAQALHAAIEGIRSHLPLRNLHWKPSSRTALRTIQELEVELVELGEVGPHRDFGGSGVLDVPLVNLCLVVCEDAEAYKTTTRNFLRDWLSLLAARRTVHAPLIVLVNPATHAGDSKSGGMSVWGKDKGVLGKIKADYNSGKRDRCVQLNLPPPGVNDPAAWPEVINKLKESLVTAFDGAILEREEEVKRGEAQRLMVGWNFCTWFLLKESLAHSFEGVNLHEDALIVYEELEAAFFQVLKEQNLSWLNRLGATSPYDDSLPILDPTAKPYRELLQHSSISIFDFRIYLFARQGLLLGRLGRITEIAKRGQWFVASLTRRLRESESDLAEHFIESWTYTASTNIVTKCDEWSQLDRPNGDYSGLIAYESARSELLDIARIQVERIGVSSGHLPDIYPFQSASSPYNPGETDDVLFESSSNGLSDDEEESAAKQATNRPNLSNKQILGAQADNAIFRSLYLDLTKKAIIAYEACGKANSVIRLKADLAALALYSEDYSAAYDLSRALAKSCADLHIWEPISKFALEGALRSHKELQMAKDEDWTNLALAYLRVCTVATPQESMQSDKGDAQAGGTGGEHAELVRLLEGLMQADVKADTEGHRAFSIKLLVDQAAFEEEGDRTVVQIEVYNALPVSLQVDAISLDLIDSQSELIIFAAEEVDLKPGSNTISAFCSTSTQGLYTLNSAAITFGAVNFGYNKLDDAAVVKVLRDVEGAEVKLKMPLDIKLDEEPNIVLEIRAGRIPMQEIRLGLRSLTPAVSYVLEGAQSDGEKVELDAQSGYLTIPDIEARGVQIVTIPYTGVPPGEVARAQIVLEYETATGSREWIDSQAIFMGLPLTVNVQDFFRPECLLSHFTIASDGREYLRVSSIDLIPPEGGSFDVESCKTSWKDTVIVSPRQPLSCLFKIKRKSTAQSDSQVPLRLAITYRSIEEECREAVESALRTIRPSHRAAVGRVVRKIVLDKAKWLPSYLAGSGLGEILDSYLSAAEGSVSQTQKPDVDGFIAAIGLKPVTEMWRTLEIPVDVPQRRLLTKVRISPSAPSRSGGIYEGRAISMDVRFTTSLAWAEDAVSAQSEGNSGDSGEAVAVAAVTAEQGGDAGKAGEAGETGPRLVFDIQASSEDWLVLGKKKGYYIGNPRNPTAVQIILIPMRAGDLFLPSITINQLDHLHPSSHPQPPSSYPQPPASQPQPQLCETYVENAAERIRVWPAKKELSAVVPIPLSLPVGVAANDSAWEREREVY